MKKLLHERLREPDYDGNCVIEHDDGYVTVVTDIEAEHLADEIEYYYSRRLMFDDGEPVRRGERFINSEGNEETIEAAFIKIVCRSGSSFDVLPTEILKRPSHKVLDADGVEIKEGDTVWDEYGKKLTVIKLKPDEDCGLDKREDLVDCGESKNGCHVYHIAEQLTHKEPDSIEKIIKYLIECGNNDSSGMYYIAADRLSAIMERDH